MADGRSPYQLGDGPSYTTVGFRWLEFCRFPLVTVQARPETRWKLNGVQRKSSEH